MENLKSKLVLGIKNRDKLVDRLKVFLVGLALTILLVISFTACEKYLDVPTYNLCSKADIIANDWKIAQVLNQGKDVTFNYNRYLLNLTNNGSASLDAKYTSSGVTYHYTTYGTWAFIKDNNDISFDFDNNEADAVYQIIKVEEKEMWLKNENGIELHFIPQ